VEDYVLSGMVPTFFWSTYLVNQ